MEWNPSTRLGEIERSFFVKCAPAQAARGVDETDAGFSRQWSQLKVEVLLRK
jgi:hypothetical protein